MRFELTNPFRDQTAFETVLRANTVALPIIKNLVPFVGQRIQ